MQFHIINLYRENWSDDPKAYLEIIYRDFKILLEFTITLVCNSANYGLRFVCS